MDYARERKRISVFNTPFFSVYENVYLVLREAYDEQQALLLFTKIMEKGLKKAYDTIGFDKGDPLSFQKTIVARDSAVGLTVSFPKVSDNKIIYQICVDPFVNLKNIVDCRSLSHTYINFKVSYLLGDNWRYTTTKHFWLGDDCIEFILIKENC